MDKRWSLVSGVGLGAMLMYLLDPDRGNRRRTFVREKTVHALRETGDAVSTQARHLGNRTRGLVATARSRFTCESVTDEVLVERVRSKLGRVVSHPHAVEVAASQGHVTVSGPILASEVKSLLAAVSRVRGVTDVENRLETHEQAGSVPGLQNGGPKE